jgi:hypothetical protein
LKGLVLLAGVFLGLITSAYTLAAPLHQYVVQVDETLERLSISACFDGAAPDRLIAHDTAMLHLERMRLRSPGTGALTVKDWEASLSGVADDACVDYIVQLKPETTGVQNGGPETRRVGRDLLTAIGDWFWRPAELAQGADIEIRFELPPGISVSTPWKRVADQTYRVGVTPRDWPGVVAFGGFEPVEIEVPGARLYVVMIDSPLPRIRESLIRWIERAAYAITTVYGVFPVAQLQVIVSPTPRGNKPVPWAYVARGGGPAVHLFVRPKFAAGEFMRDWSVVHEMSHLFLPYLEWGDAWLVEGLPTYYQNVAMARGGLIPPEEAWRRLYAGFEIARDVGSEYTVYEAGQRLGRRGLYRRVYWGGAAYMLAADLRLRELSGGKSALGDVLQEIRRCCLNGSYRWPAEDFVDRLDEVSGTKVFSSLFEQEITSRRFPDYQSVYDHLGIEILGGHPIFVDGTAAQYRNAIMAPR